MNSKQVLKDTLKDLLQILIPAIIIVFLLTKFILVPCTVEGSSMYPILKNGDFGYSFIISKNISIKRFNIVVVDADDKLLVKRIIGLPNELVEYNNNKLYIDGEYVPEPFLSDNITDDFSIQLKDDEYYCLGDNREVSRDSRYYGPFTSESFVSTHFFTIYPFEDFGMK